MPISCIESESVTDIFGSTDHKHTAYNSHQSSNDERAPPSKRGSTTIRENTDERLNHKTSDRPCKPNKGDIGIGEAKSDEEGRQQADLNSPPKLKPLTRDRERYNQG